MPNKEKSKKHAESGEDRCEKRASAKLSSQTTAVVTNGESPREVSRVEAARTAAENEQKLAASQEQRTQLGSETKERESGAPLEGPRTGLLDEKGLAHAAPENVVRPVVLREEDLGGDADLVFEQREPTSQQPNVIRLLQIAVSEQETIRPRRRRRVALSDAMRKHGLDEHAIAETYVGVVKTLSKNTTCEGAEKLLVDVLKECSRVLEPPVAKERGSERRGSNAPATVHLSHNVPRPARKTKESDS